MIQAHTRTQLVLAVSCWRLLLAVGCWFLVVGCWRLLLAVGCWFLVVGCWLRLVGGLWLLFAVVAAAVVVAAV